MLSVDNAVYPIAKLCFLESNLEVIFQTHTNMSLGSVSLIRLYVTDYQVTHGHETIQSWIFLVWNIDLDFSLPYGLNLEVPFKHSQKD